MEYDQTDCTLLLYTMCPSKQASKHKRLTKKEPRHLKEA